MTNAGSSRHGSPRARRRAERHRRALWCAAFTVAGLGVGPALAPVPDHAVSPLDRAARAPAGATKVIYLFGPPARWPGAIHWRYNATHAPAAFADAAYAVGRLQ